MLAGKARRDGQKPPLAGDMQAVPRASARGASKPSSVEVTAMPRLLMATPDSCPLARGTGLDVRDNNILSNYAVL